MSDKEILESIVKKTTRNFDDVKISKSKYEKEAQQLGAGWHYDAKQRGIYNAKKGLIISRRQFDKYYGLLKKQGFKSFEEKRDTRKKQGVTKRWRQSKAHGGHYQAKFTTSSELISFLESEKLGNRSYMIYQTGMIIEGVSGSTKSSISTRPLISKGFANEGEKSELHGGGTVRKSGFMTAEMWLKNIDIPASDARFLYVKYYSAIRKH